MVLNRWMIIPLTFLALEVECFPIGRSLHLGATKSARRPAPPSLHEKPFRDDDAQDASFKLLDIPLLPTPGISDPLPVMIPFLGLGYALVDPLAAATAGFLFALLRTTALKLILFPEVSLDSKKYGPQQEIDEDEEEEIRLRNERIGVDLFCLGVSTGTVLIAGEDFYPALIGLSIAAGVLLMTTVREIVDEEQLTDDDKMMNRWDKRLLKKDDDGDD